MSGAEKKIIPQKTTVTISKAVTTDDTDCLEGGAVIPKTKPHPSKTGLGGAPAGAKAPIFTGLFRHD
jgi:hypothetical protein